MDIILNKANINVSRLKSYITRLAAKELSYLTQPCYYPKTKMFYFELLNILGLKDKDVKEFIKRTLKGSKAEKWKSALWKDPGTYILLLVMHIFLQRRERSAFETTLLYFLIVHYSRLMFKQIKYCDEDAFRYTLENLTRTHLFFREGSIPNSLYYLSRAMKKTFTEPIKKWDIEGLINFIVVARSRISQSVKSFAEHYYRNKSTGAAIKTQMDDPSDEENKYQYQVQQRGQKIVDLIIKKLTVYKKLDRKALEEARRLSKVKMSIATIIAKNLTDDQHTNNIKIVVQLFIKDVADTKMICGDLYYDYVKKLMSVKRTKSQVYFKSQVNILLKEILESAKYLDEYEKYTTQTQFTINTFLAYYITLIIRNSIC